MHLWIGLPCGIILFVVCLTGTMYVFNKEITRWADRDKFYITNVPADGKTLPVATLSAAAEKQLKGFTVSALLIPENPKEAWIFTLAPKATRSNDDKAGAATGKKETTDKNKKPNKSLLINQYTAQVQGDPQTPTSKFFASVLQLHRWLLIDRSIGGVITGVAAMLFVLLEITGLILWMPAKLKSMKKWNAWKPGFSIKKGGWKRVNHDLHKSLGFYTFVIITIMGLTGPVFAFDWYRAGFNDIMGNKVVKKDAPGPQSQHNGATALSMEDILQKAAVIYPYAADVKITMAKDSLGSVVIAKNKNGFFASAATDRVTLDQYSGEVLKLERFADKTTGAKIASLVKPIHTGEVFGTFSKILYLLACLIATSLPVTGTLIWLNKRKKKKPAHKTATVQPGFTVTHGTAVANA